MYQDGHGDAAAEPSQSPVPAEGTVRILADHRLRAGHAATTVLRTASGVLVVDGTSSPSAERLTRVCVVEAAHLDDALASAKAIALEARAVEIRPVRSER